VTTAVGPIEVERIFFQCPACRQSGFFADQHVGIDGFLTAGAERLITLAGTMKSFERAQILLKELAGWQVSDETIRQTCHHLSREASDWMAKEAPAAERFETAAGMPELQIDAGKANTNEGWKDVKLAVFAKRPLGKPAVASDWDKRKLPKPTAHVIAASIEGAEKFGERCRVMANALNLWMPVTIVVSSTVPTEGSILADGAEWIWNIADRHFSGVRQILDIFHAAEHLADGAKAAFGEGTPEAQNAKDRGVLKVLEKGYDGVVEWIGELTGQMPVGGDGAALGAELNYFASHKTRLIYESRLAGGESIGSGMVEGRIKQLIKSRIKQTGAKWRKEHVAPFVEMINLVETPEWQAFWKR
jgi:hypothetical protein